MQIDARGKVMLGLAFLLLLVVICWTSREVMHMRSDSALTKEVEQLQTEVVERINEKEEWRLQSVKLTSELEATRRQLATSEDTQQSYSKEVRADGSSLVRIDSSVKKRLEQTEEQVRILASQFVAEKEVSATLQRNLTERSARVATLENEVQHLTLDTKKSSRRVGILAGAGFDRPTENPRLGVAGFMGPFMATISADPSPAWDQSRSANAQALVGFTW